MFNARVNLVSCKPLTALDEEISQAAKRYCQAYAEYAEAEKQLKRQIRKTDLPQCDLPLDENCSDKLEQVGPRLLSLSCTAVLDEGAGSL